MMLTSGEIAAMQDSTTARWHGSGVAAGGGGDLQRDLQPVFGTGLKTGLETGSDAGFAALVQANHRANFELWHEEDKARDPGAPDAEIARVKHAIDGLNQRRNDLVEEMDGWLLRVIGEQTAGAPLHSETPGMMVDRMSILALKIYHTREEVTRAGAAEAHRLRNVQRLELLLEQRADLAECLDTLWAEVAAGRRRFKLYRQMKMYNDPELNPVLYGRMGD